MRKTLRGLGPFLLILGGCGPQATGIGPSGGTVGSLYFAVVGDTRPGSTDVLADYPTPIITKIFADIQSLKPKPQFVVSTGDYMDSTNTGGEQLDLYLSAAKQFTGGPLFPVMGNHECLTSTNGNCPGTYTTLNLQAFKSKMLPPINQTLPYYSIDMSAPNKSWTAKLVVIACNAWDSTQKDWLSTELAKPTTYTIVARHEPLGAANSPPCIPDADNIIQANPYSVMVVGHEHYFQYIGFKKEVIVGNGGAPLYSSTATYGYATFQQTSGGFLVNEYDYQTNAPIQTFTMPY